MPASSKQPQPPPSLALTSTHGQANSLAVKPNKATARNIPAFLNKLYTMINDPGTNELIRWNADGDSFVVPSPNRFGREVLPRFFKHSNFGSFVRQLNMYGFKKVPHLQQGVLKQDDDANELLEFSNPNCTRAQPDLLCLIRRQKARTEPISTETTLNLPSLLSDLAAIRQHQTAISADLKDLQTSNRALWEEAIQSRERHTRHQETINKILRFLATVFGGQVAGSEAGASPRNVPEEVVDEDDRNGTKASSKEGKGKGKAYEGAVPAPHVHSRLLLEDVKGRREARAREAEEDAAYELDDLEEISSGKRPQSKLAPSSDTNDPSPTASQYTPMPVLARSTSNYGYNNNTTSNDGPSDSSRFTTIPSTSGTPYFDTPSSSESHPQYPLSPDLLSSLLAPPSSNNIGSVLNVPNFTNNNNTLSTSTPSSKNNYNLVLSPNTNHVNDPFSGFPLDPNLMASFLPSLSPASNARITEDYSQSILDHNNVLQEVTSEKADLDERTSQLEKAIAKLMDGLPVETRDALSEAGGMDIGTEPSEYGNALASGSESWVGKNVMGDAELDTFLSQYVHTASEDPSPSNQPYLFNPISPIPALQPPLTNYSGDIVSIDELMSESPSSTVASTPVGGHDDYEWSNISANGSPGRNGGKGGKGKGKKRKSDVIDVPVDATRRSSRKRV